MPRRRLAHTGRSTSMSSSCSSPRRRAGPAPPHRHLGSPREGAHTQLRATPAKGERPGDAIPVGADGGLERYRSRACVEHRCTSGCARRSTRTATSSARSASTAPASSPRPGWMCGPGVARGWKAWDGADQHTMAVMLLSSPTSQTQAGGDSPRGRLGLQESDQPGQSRTHRCTPRPTNYRTVMQILVVSPGSTGHRRRTRRSAGRLRAASP